MHEINTVDYTLGQEVNLGSPLTDNGIGMLDGPLVYEPGITTAHMVSKEELLITDLEAKLAVMEARIAKLEAMLCEGSGLRRYKVADYE